MFILKIHRKLHTHFETLYLKYKVVSEDLFRDWLRKLQLSFTLCYILKKYISFLQKAFFIWLADGILRIVLIMHIYDKITKAKVNSKVTKAKYKPIISRNHVSKKDNCKRGR